ncbi:MAG: discoidin domain-containing protein [Bacteroidetes bacterium]|nr:discoidin domain-containing protein [Bacteroidota bacterium]
MQHADINRTGWYNQETTLTVNNVKPGTFGKLFERIVDDQVYAQPLVIFNVNIPGKGTRNILIIATVSNSVYAFDADSANISAPYWQINLSGLDSRPVRNTDMTGSCGGNYRDFSGNIGIVGTPVADTTTNTVYLVSRSVNTSTNSFSQYLHAIDIITGNEKFNSPQVITASVAGNGDGNVNGVVSFDPLKQNQRGGLLLLNGTVYIAWASHCDWGPYHGWILGYDKSTLQQKVVYNTTPNGYFGGIWMSGAAPSADESGNIYVAVGNGSVGYNNDPSSPVNRSESAIKLSPSGNTLAVSSFFSPKNIEELEATDLDFGVSQMLLIPGTNRVITSCKDGKIYLMDRDNMGGYNSANNNVVQTIDLGLNAHLRSSMSYYKGAQNEYIYTWSENALLKAFPYNRNTNQFDLANTISSGVQGPIGNNGAFLSVSSNGSVDTTAILWAAHAADGDANQSVRPGILRAIDANDVTKELWNSGIYASDVPGNYAKFNCPVIANGKVYLATFSNKVIAYGIVNDPLVNTCNAPNAAIGKIAVPSSTFNTSSGPASAAIDGDANSGWSSLAGDPQSLYIDLGSRYDICKMVLKWGAGIGKDFYMQSSDDAIHWKTLVTITGNTAPANIFPVNITARYVRMYGLSAATSTGYSLNEFEVYGAVSSYQCPEPTNLYVTNNAENSVVLNWNGNGNGQFNVQYKTVSATEWSSVITDTGYVKLENLACATDYFFRIRKKCNPQDSSLFSIQSSFSTLACNTVCGALPTRWSTQDIGDVDAAGSACYSDGVFDLRGSGDDIWSTQDGFRFAYKTFVGDGEIKARVVSMDNSNEWNKCGIMFRESFEPGSRHAFIALTSKNGIAFQARTQTNGTSVNVNTGAGTIVSPYWLKLFKRGSVYTAYGSPDGNNWTQLGDNLDAGFGAGTPVYAGLALTSHDNGIISVAKVDNCSIGGEQQLNLYQFTASLTLDKTVSLRWITTLESNVQNFIVEKSRQENAGYAPIDTIAAENGGSVTETYVTEDKAPFSGINYYRLKIISVDGSIKYSEVVAVRITDSKAPLLFPNPVRGTLHIFQGTEPIKFINLYDIMGRHVGSFTNPAGNNSINFRVSSYANGIYIIELRTEESVYRQKIVVSN